ncbi:hypothetical protein VFPFJ_04587 [Purpureocillium lilacinum]|uniref:Uncharacterized protein n=1 Tax=Purpureocillium lilacinum TaxID=33203 RepID=A0A179HJJ6_PURLI|nr:hypothetical protein VFPFJ_04587 [Purpureocillium lilacinum]OAQ90427.1 hypothetical protein VFPFJ_04587 [Purpureocillium lilacinum]
MHTLKWPAWRVPGSLSCLPCQGRRVDPAYCQATSIPGWAHFTTASDVGGGHEAPRSKTAHAAYLYYVGYLTLVVRRYLVSRLEAGAGSIVIVFSAAEQQQDAMADRLGYIGCVPTCLRILQ